MSVLLKDVDNVRHHLELKSFWCVFTRTVNTYISEISDLVVFFLQLWVSPGSQTAYEKQYFDSHLAPFYRIEQVFSTLMALFLFN